MNGIEKITERIDADVRQEIADLTAQAQAQAQEILAQAQAQAEAEKAARLQRAQAEAAQRQERLESVAALECRKLTLATKQEMVSAAFDRALEMLTTMEDSDYIDLLAGLAAKAAVSGREQVIFSPRDRNRIGKQVVTRANDILARAVAPKLPDELTETRAGALLDKVVTAGSALLAGTGMLTMAEETRSMSGGLVLRNEQVETNCSFEALLRLGRETLGAEVAGVLFDGE